MNRLLARWYFPVSLKYISLVAYVAFIVIGFMVYTTDAALIRQLRNTNLGNLIVWSYWWPAIVVLAVVFGRVWCMVCPVEVVTAFFSRIGLRRKRPAWLLSGWGITIFYIIILFVGMQGLAIHQNPFYMSVYMLSIVVVSIVIGGFYEKNAFCRYVCPVGYLLGLYSRLAIFGWRVKSKGVCDSCKDKSCIHKKYHYQQNYKSCGVDLYPAHVNDNNDCILCAGCLKTCGTYQSNPIPERPNPGYRRIGFASDLMQLKLLKTSEMIFVLVVSGFIISQIWSEWNVTNNYLVYLPNLVIGYLGITSSILIGLVRSLVLFVAVPLVIWYLPWLSLRMAGGSMKLKEYFLSYGIAFIPIIAAAHVSKSIIKSVSRIPYFEYAFTDMVGLDTAQKINAGEIQLQTNPFWLNALVTLLLVIVFALGIWLSIRVVRALNQKFHQESNSMGNYLIPFVYGGIFFVMIIAWRFWG